MTFYVVMTQRTMFALTNFSCHPERSEAESNFFRLRSQTSLRSVCSSLRSEFDYAQDDVDEKSAEQSKAGSTNNQRTMYAEAHPGISPMANIFVRAAICERAPIALAHKCEPECLQSKHRVDNEMGHQKTKGTRRVPFVFW